jgi:heat shock protein HslJ
MRGRTITVLAAVGVAVALAAALAGCGDEEGPASAATAADLDGNTFVSTRAEGMTLVDESVVTLEFADGNVSANAGCNQMNGGYEVSDGTLQVGELASTMMACPDDMARQDEQLAELLTSDPEVTLVGSELTLRSGDTVLVLDRSDAGGE